MIKKWRFHELDAYHLNVGVPIVITLFFLIINLEIFAILFVENMIRILEMYLYIIVFVLVVRVLLTRKQKSRKKKLKLSLYEFGVLSSVLILIFLVINLNCSSMSFEKKFPVNYRLVYQLETLPMKPAYFKVFEINSTEFDKYYDRGFNMKVQINRSCFGYEFLESRTFEKIQ